MKPLLNLCSFLETATGLALIAAPTLVVRLLLGGELAGAGVPLGRVAGFGLLSLGLACWPGSDLVNPSASAHRGMLTYNVMATLYFLWLGIAGQGGGPLLWPAAVLHGLLSILLIRQSVLPVTGVPVRESDLP